MSISADTVINRCTLADGTVAFQETPCIDAADESDAGGEGDSAASSSANARPTFVNPFDEAEEAPPPSAPAPSALPSKDRGECEKTTRDAIDLIDFEMRKGYTTEEGQQYLAELLELTRQLRACKQL